MLTIGLDVGGTKVLGALVRAAPGAPPELVDTVREPSGAHGPGVLDRMEAALSVLLQRSGDERPVAVGAGLAGLVGSDGRVLRSPNAPGLEGVDVAGRLARVSGLPVEIRNDADCVALAAAALRTPPVADLVAVTLGTGIGGGFVVGGELVRGARGFAGEPGHMVVDPSGPPCPCGQRGCWERFAAGSALEEQARAAVLAGRGEGLPGPDGTLDGRRVIEAAAQGLPAAREVVDGFARWVALGLANLVNLLDPAVVVLGGGVTEAGDVLLGPVREAMAAHPMAALRRVPIEVAPGGPAAGALGAAVAAGSRAPG